VNGKLLQRLDAIERLPGFTGKRGIGKRVGSTPLQGNAHLETSGPIVSESAEDMGCEDTEARTGQEHIQDLERLTYFMEHITD